MPTGPKGQKRPADVIGNAVKVMRIATGEEPEDLGNTTTKNKAAQELGRAGGRKRAESMPPERRAEIGNLFQSAKDLLDGFATKYVPSVDTD